MKKICNMICNIIGVISGFISIIFAFVVKKMSIGSYENNYTYGGDAYTGMQNASAQAANNVQALADIVRTGLFALLFVIGVALICYFVSKIINEMLATDEANAAAMPEPAEIGERASEDISERNLEDLTESKDN